MKKYLFSSVFLFIAQLSYAQLDIYNNNKNDLFVFPVDSVRKLNDSMKFVRILLPENSTLQQNQACIVIGNKRLRGTAKEMTIGNGTFKLNTGGYSYFTLLLANKDSIPKKGDLLSTPLYYPANFKGRIYQLIRQSVYLKTSSGDSVFSFKKAMYLDEKSENALIKTLVDDIHYVAKEMKKQQDGQDQMIKGGMFNGKKLFDAMALSTQDQLNSFLDYIIARPVLYATNAWSISEIFATWMVGGTPTALAK